MTKVFTNGCFDIIHPGHLRLLKYCASLGDHVLVGIDSDRRVKTMKDPGRPINSQEIRKFILLNFKWINDVIIFDSDEELTSLVAEYRPDYMIVGSDWKDKKIIGSEHAKIIGFFDRINEHSTTNIIERIADR
jgi:D-beta-D-heptose 7-phosphate kinase/D-beta-D-heptose 1-phosphate adenosyltransferase